MVGNNNIVAPRNYTVWILDRFDTAPLHIINPYGEEGIVELGDDRRGESNNNKLRNIELRMDQPKKGMTTSNIMQMKSNKNIEE